MQTQALPFTGYSWPFTQHAIAIKPKTLYGLLTCASLFEGKSNCGREITKLMIENGLLTPNVRGGRADAWRDYQQVLAELGLIYSTKIERRLKITDAGKMFLSGELGFSELMTVQALRYQYPNGQKYDLQSRLRTQLGTRANNLIDLYISSGISIKPATLIARVLVDLVERGENGHISVDECLAFLLPLKDNREWVMAVEAIVKSRKLGDLDSTNRHARRNVQDWFKFMSMTDFFTLEKEGLCLSNYGKYAISQLKNFSSSQSQPSSFWKPTDSSKASRIDWFDYFGEIPFNQSVMRPLKQIDPIYEKSNYVGGLDEETNDDSVKISDAKVTLTELTRRTSRLHGRTPSFMDPNIALANLEQGIVRRYTKTLAHEELILSLAEHLRKQGAKIYEDLDSIDLLAIWPDKTETLFEVKTITPRNIQQRIRSAVGQLEEYSYRRAKMTHTSSDKVLVINTELPKDSWYIDFLVKHLNITLVSKTKDGFKRHEAKKSSSGVHWAF